MPSAPGPRSQTGLVPTSYRLQINRLNSPDNWKSLPPRPPPEKFPYRDGGGKQKKGRTLCNKKKNARVLRDECKSNGLKKERKNKLEWNICTGRELPGPKDKHKKEKDSIKGQTLDYIRKSAKRRAKIHELQKKLDDEINTENLHYGFGEIPSCVNDIIDESFNVSCCDSNSSNASIVMDPSEEASRSIEDKSFVSLEMNRLKESFLRRIEQFDSDDSDGSTQQSSSHHHENIIPHYSIGDASTIESLDTDAASFDLLQVEMGQKENSIEHRPKPLNTLYTTQSYNSNSISGKPHTSVSSYALDQSSEGASTPLSKDSAWENLSHDQQNRIRQRSQMIYASKFRSCQTHLTDNKEVEKSALIERVDDNLDILHTYKIGGEHEVTPCNICADENSKEALFSFEKNNSCVSDLITAITDGLFPKTNTTKFDPCAVDKDPAKNQAYSKLNDDHGAKKNEKISARKNLPENVPKPRHPYKLPLKPDIRNTMINENKK